MANPMQAYQQFPGPLPRTGQGVATGQPRVGYQRAEQWGKYFTYVHAFEPLPASASENRQFSVDGSYDFFVQKMTLLMDNGAVLLQTQVSPQGELFESAPIYGSGWGSGQFPEYVGQNGLIRVLGGNSLPAQVPRVIARNSIFLITATDDQQAPEDNTVILAYHGTKAARQIIVPARAYFVAKPYTYAATYNARTFDNNGQPTGPIPAGQTRIQSILVDNEGDFDVNALTCVSDGPCTVQINSDSENWFLLPLRSELIGGSLLEAMPVQGEFSGEHPFTLPGPRLITAAGYIQVTVTNLDLENDNRVQVAFQGQRLYPAGGM